MCLTKGDPNGSKASSKARKYMIGAATEKSLLQEIRMSKELKVNDKLYGFTVTDIREIKEIEGRLVEMLHDETGARLVWADNGEENKLFSVGFKTLPEDSTGVFHILEHSVLCGSDKFPVKEPFVELLKTSMNTFLNAMTYPDKTLYPVSSRIKQDYLNLSEVYLDAVFKPAILTNPNIFYQEGWHVDTAGAEPAFKGVVYNEMKGAMSDVDQVAERAMLKLLFPDNCYGYNSGGDPEEIPELTYDSFIERYKRFYHPSNAYFYLDGDVPLDETLAMIEGYLEGYGRLEDLPEIDQQEPTVEHSEMKFASNDESDKRVLVLGRIIGSWADRDKMLALSVLLEQLADSNESPLKRAVLSAGLAEDMELYVADGIDQPYLMMLFRGVADGDDTEEKITGIVSSVIAKVKEEGIKKTDLEASINQLDFRFRQYPEPQGLYRANAVFSSWLYGGDPALYLSTNEAIDTLRKMAENGEYELLAADILGDVAKYSSIMLSPDTALEAEQAAEEAARVKAELDRLGEGGYKDLEKLNEDLVTWQQTPDSEEALSKIPMLALSDISAEPELIPTEEKNVGGVRLLYHKLPSNGIIYINAYFPVTGLSLEELPAAALITEFYKDLPTENYDVLALQNEIRMHVGSISFGLDIMAEDTDRDGCVPCIRARASVLEDKLSYAEDLLIEILTRTKFEDKALMKELIKQIDEDGKRAAVSSGHRLAMMEARSHWSARDAAAEAVNGWTFLQYMHKMAAASDEDIESFQEFARKTVANCITSAGVIVSETASEYADLTRFAEMLPAGEKQPAKAEYRSTLSKRMGIQIPAQVSFAVSAYDMAADGFEMNGNMAVASNIISLAQLWNEIRVQGGSYGASMSTGRTGNIFCYTYRDPSPERSLGIFKTTASFIEGFKEAAPEDIEGFIISSIANTEPLMSPAAKGRAADDFYLSGFADEKRKKFRSEMLATKPQDLAAQKDILTKMAEEACTCVVGPKAALEACDGLDIVEL